MIQNEMDRRGFLRGLGGVGLIGLPTASKPQTKVIRQGSRQLKDITPAELEELLDWCDIPRKMVLTVEDTEEPDKPSLHPVMQFTYSEGTRLDHKPEIRATFFSRCGMDDWDEETFDISIGSLWTSYYPMKDPVETVRWFLERGFRVFETPILNRQS